MFIADRATNKKIENPSRELKFLIKKKVTVKTIAIDVNLKISLNFSLSLIGINKQTAWKAIVNCM